MQEAVNERFIISFLKEYLGGEEYTDLEKDLEYLDWDKIAYQLILHRIIPIFMKYMRGKSKLGCLNTYLNDLFSFFEDKAMNRDISRIEEASNLSRQIKDSNVNAVIVKGPLNSLSFYCDYGVRVYEDIDILVEKKDIKLIKDILKEQGFQQGVVEHNNRNFVKASRYEIMKKEMYTHETIEFYKFVNGIRTDIMVDVNHSLSWKGHDGYEGYSSMNLEDFISSKRLYSKDSYNIVGPKMEQLLAYTMLHLYNEEIFFVWQEYWKYNFGDIQLLKYCDVIKGMHKNLDWDAFHKYVMECEIIEPIKNVVTKIENIFGKEIIPRELHCYLGEIKSADYFFDKNGHKTYWLSSFRERVFDQKIRLKEVEERNIELI